MQLRHSTLIMAASLAGFLCNGLADAESVSNNPLIIRNLMEGASISASKDRIQFSNGLMLSAGQWDKSGAHFNIALMLPVLAPKTKHRAKALNGWSADYAHKEMRALEKSEEASQSTRPQSAHDDYVEADLEIILATRKVISLIIHKSTFFWPAMHPQDATKTITYALDSGRIISLSDIFRPDSGYLNIISNYCIKSLMQRSQVRELSNREWVERGAAAKAENFTDWNIGRDGLLITFEEYQVAPYASGSFEVTIPYSRLASVIRKDGILKDVLKQHQK